MLNRDLSDKGLWYWPYTTITINHEVLECLDDSELVRLLNAYPVAVTLILIHDSSFSSIPWVYLVADSRIVHSFAISLYGAIFIQINLSYTKIYKLIIPTT